MADIEGEYLNQKRNISEKEMPLRVIMAVKCLLGHEWPKLDNYHWIIIASRLAY